MKRHILTTALILASAGAPTAVAQVITNDFVQRGTASREDQVYKEGQDAMDQNRWADAAAKFDTVARTKNPRTDAAMYWKAYSLNKSGRTQEALETIAALRKQSPTSKWAQDA